MKKIVVLFFIFFLVQGSYAQKKKSSKDYLFTLTTDLGEIKFILFDETPLHKKNFLKLTKKGFYDGTTFHRIIDGFMIQGGDPNSKDNDANNDGIGGPGYTIPNELSAGFKHVRGSVAAARMGDQVNPNKESSGSQFYIVENHDGSPFLDGSYTVFGQVISGLDVIDKIAEQKKDGRDRPEVAIAMKIKVEKIKRTEITSQYNYQYK